MKNTSEVSLHTFALDRRTFPGASLGTCAITPLVSLSVPQLSSSRTGSLTKEERDRMTPSQVLP
jgi:hypothetical protein